MDTYQQKVINENGVASLWRFHELLSCYALVWSSEEPNLFKILRQKTFTREDQGTESGPYLYTRTQFPLAEEGSI